ncbi:MAG: HNH endonuclease [Bacteroidaceae bacterium]|nr:HNH endonuclease [Bacteroidaceae bacterium]
MSKGQYRMTHWDEHKEKLLRKHYPKGDLKVLAEMIGVSVTAVRSRAKLLGLRRRVNKCVPWTDRQVKYLRKHYADMSCAELSKKVHHSACRVAAKAYRLGLKKSKEYKQWLGKALSSHEHSKAQRFVKGMQSHNKGKRIEEFMSAEGAMRFKSAWFKKGHRPKNAIPVGTERVHDGYVVIRTEDGWIQKHRLVWKQVNGEIPEGLCVCFIDGNRQNCDISNLCLMDRAEKMRRAVKSESMEIRKNRIASMKVTRNKNIRRDKLRIHFGLEPVGKLVKRW